MRRNKKIQVTETEEDRKKAITDAIFNEKIDDIYKGTIYQIDIDNNHNHYEKDVVGDNDNIYKNKDNYLDITDDEMSYILSHASFKPAKEILFYHSRVDSSFASRYRELITRELLPYPNFRKIAFPKIKNNIDIPAFLYLDGKTLVTADELEFYLEYHLNPKNYCTNLEYFDARVELKKQLDAIYQNTYDDFIKIMESRDYSENYKIEKIKAKYKNIF